MTIDFTEIDWNCIGDEELQFYYKEAIEANEAVLKSIDNTNNKVFQFLAIACGILAVLTGLCLSVWGEEGKGATAWTFFSSCIGFGVVVAILIITIFPRKTYSGKALPELIFSGNLYKLKMRKHYSDAIASCHVFINENMKVHKDRSNLLTTGLIVFLLIPIIIIVLRIAVF